MRLTTLSLALALGLLTGCAGNPAADAPVASVEPAEAPAADGAAADAAQGDVTQAAGDMTEVSLAADSKVSAVGAKITGKHDVTFPISSSSLKAKGDKLASVMVVMDMTALEADKPKLTGHLKSPDFFNVEAHPTAKFEASSFEPAEGATWTVTGTLTLGAKTNKVSFPADISSADGVWSIKAAFGINRQDWGINYPGKPDDLIRDEVLINLDLTTG